MTSDKMKDLRAQIAQLETSYLNSIITMVHAEVARRNDEKIREAKTQVMQIAASLGLTPEDLVKQITPRKASTKGTKIGSVAMQYQSPDDPALQWTGRGRKPAWFVALLESGKTVDDLRIAA